MFAQRFFSGRYFGARYWADEGAAAIAAAATPTGGWTHDPFSRRRRIPEDDEEQTSDAPPVTTLPIEPIAAPMVDLVALDARIAALGEEIEQSRKRSRVSRLSRDLAALRAIHAGEQRRRRQIVDDETWFLLS